MMCALLVLRGHCLCFLFACLQSPAEPEALAGEYEKIADRRKAEEKWLDFKQRMLKETTVPYQLNQASKEVLSELVHVITPGCPSNVVSDVDASLYLIAYLNDVKLSAYRRNQAAYKLRSRKRATVHGPRGQTRESYVLPPRVVQRPSLRAANLPKGLVESLPRILKSLAGHSLPPPRPKGFGLRESPITRSTPPPLRVRQLKGGKANKISPQGRAKKETKIEVTKQHSSSSLLVSSTDDEQSESPAAQVRPRPVRRPPPGPSGVVSLAGSPVGVKGQASGQKIKERAAMLEAKLAVRFQPQDSIESDEEALRKYLTEEQKRQTTAGYMLVSMLSCVEFKIMKEAFMNEAFPAMSQPKKF